MNKNKIKLLSEQYRISEMAGINQMVGKNLISTDIQPEYESFFNFKIWDFIEFLNNNFNDLNSLTFLYNGQETLGMIAENDYKNWLYENGLKESIIEQSTLYDKGYGSFRSCLDFSVEEGIEEEQIVNLIKFMMKNNIHDVSDFSKSNWKSWLKENDYKNIKEFLENSGEAFYIPDLVEELKTIPQPIILCGGGIKECLKEVELALMAIDKNYSLLTKFVY